MTEYVVKNGPWFLCEGPAWSVSTWTQDEREATKYESIDLAQEVVDEAIELDHRPFGCRAFDAKAVKATV